MDLCGEGNIEGDLFGMIAAKTTELRCIPCAIGGTADHVHLLARLHTVDLRGPVARRRGCLTLANSPRRGLLGLLAPGFSRGLLMEFSEARTIANWLALDLG